MAQVKDKDIREYWSFVEEKWHEMAREYDEEPPSEEEEIVPLVLHNGLRVIPDRYGTQVEIVDDHKRLVVTLQEQEILRVAQKLVEIVYSRLWHLYEVFSEKEWNAEKKVTEPKILPEWIDNNELAVEEVERELKVLEKELTEAYYYREKALTYQVLMLKLRQALNILEVIEYKLR